MSASEHGLPDGLFDAFNILRDEGHPKHASLNQALDAFTVSTFIERYLAYRMDSTPVESVASLQSQAIGALIKHLKSSSDREEELRNLADIDRGLDNGSYRALLLDPRLPYTMLRKLLEMRPCEAFGPAPHISGIQEAVERSQRYALAQKKFSEFELLSLNGSAALTGLDLKSTLPEAFQKLDWSNILLLLPSDSSAALGITPVMPVVRGSIFRRTGSIKGSIDLALHGLSPEEAIHKVDEIVSTLTPPEYAACERDRYKISLHLDHNGRALVVYILLKLYSTPAEALLDLAKVFAIGYDGATVWITPKAALSNSLKAGDGLTYSEDLKTRADNAEVYLDNDESFSDHGDSDSEESEPADSVNVDALNDSQFESLKLAISERLGTGYQPFGYKNYLTRRIRCIVQFHTTEEMWDKQLTAPLCVPWDLETRVIPKMLEHTNIQLEDILIPVHDPAKLDPTTAILPPMYDTKDERGNLRYLLGKQEYAFKGQHRILDELYGVLRSLRGWWVASGVDGEEEFGDFQYRTDVEECVHYLAERSRRRDDDST